MIFELTKELGRPPWTGRPIVPETLGQLQDLFQLFPKSRGIDPQRLVIPGSVPDAEHPSDPVQPPRATAVSERRIDHHLRYVVRLSRRRAPLRWRASSKVSDQPERGPRLWDRFTASSAHCLRIPPRRAGYQLAQPRAVSGFARSRCDSSTS